MGGGDSSMLEEYHRSHDEGYKWSHGKHGRHRVIEWGDSSMLEEYHRSHDKGYKWNHSLRRLCDKEVVIVI